MVIFILKGLLKQVKDSSFAHPYGMQKVDVVCFTDS